MSFPGRKYLYIRLCHYGWASQQHHQGSTSAHCCSTLSPVSTPRWKSHPYCHTGISLPAIITHTEYILNNTYWTTTKTKCVTRNTNKQEIITTVSYIKVGGNISAKVLLIREMLWPGTLGVRRSEMYWSMSPEQALKMNERKSNKKSTRQNKLGENLKKQDNTDWT